MSDGMLSADTCRWCKHDIVQIHPTEDRWVHLHTISPHCRLGWFGLFIGTTEAEPKES